MIFIIKIQIVFIPKIKKEKKPVNWGFFFLSFAVQKFPK